MKYPKDEEHRFELQRIEKIHAMNKELLIDLEDPGLDLRQKTTIGGMIAIIELLLDHLGWSIEVKKDPTTRTNLS